jgi:hypothetical protein
MTKRRRERVATGAEQFAGEIRDRQSNVVWPGPLVNARLLGKLLWKGSQGTTAVQRIGLAIFGLTYLYVGLLVLALAKEKRSLWVAMAATPWLALGARVIHNAFRKQETGVGTDAKTENAPQAGATTDLIRSVGRFLSGLLIATIGTAAVESSVYGVIRPSMPEMLRMTYLLDATVAFGLGYGVYQKWRLAQWPWVGAAGVCWFGLGLYRLWAAGSPVIYREISGIGCVYDMSIASCTYYPIFTSPSLRALFYAAGAFCCLGIRNYYRKPRMKNVGC